jgi:hypothetical protein
MTARRPNVGVRRRWRSAVLFRVPPYLYACLPSASMPTLHKKCTQLIIIPDFTPFCNFWQKAMIFPVFNVLWHQFVTIPSGKYAILRICQNDWKNGFLFFAGLLVHIIFKEICHEKINFAAFRRACPVRCSRFTALRLWRPLRFCGIGSRKFRS